MSQNYQPADMADHQEYHIMPVWTQSRIEEACDLYKKGFSFKDIATRLDSSRGAVSIRINAALGVKKVRQKPARDNQKPARESRNKSAGAAQPITIIPNISESDIVQQGHRVSFEDLETNACRWPMGGHPGVDPDFGFCGKEQFRGVPGHERFAGRSCYCLGHLRQSLDFKYRRQLDEALTRKAGEARSP